MSDVITLASVAPVVIPSVVPMAQVITESLTTAAVDWLLANPQAISVAVTTTIGVVLDGCSKGGVGPDYWLVALLRRSAGAIGGAAAWAIVRLLGRGR